MHTPTRHWLLCAATMAALPALANAQITQEPAANSSTETPTTDPQTTQARSVTNLNWQPEIDGAMRAVLEPRTPVLITPVYAHERISDDAFLQAHKADVGKTTIDRMHYDVQEGTHWAMGLAYKASAGEEGFTYMPFLGSDAPKTYGVTMRLGSATLGGKPIELQQATDVSRASDRIILDRGPIDVWYDMGLESVEQSFALEVAGVNAELVLSIDVDSDLAFENQGDGVAYLNELGGVTYSHAVVIDGAGNRLQLPIVADAKSITLTVPASYMKDSVAPVVVDPIWATYQVHPGYSKNLSEPDVAYDLTTDRFAFAHTSEFSATDFDVWMETRSPSGIVDLLVTIDFTGGNVQTPSVANDNTSNQFLVTSRRLDTVSGFWEIIGRTVDATDINQRSPVFLIGDVNTQWDNFGHDVGGKSQGASLFLCAWQRHFVVQTRMAMRRRMITPIVPFSTSTAPTISGLTGVASNTLFDYTKMRVSESSGTAAVAEWRMVFISEEKSNGDQSVATLRIADDGTQSDSLTEFPTQGAFTLVDLDVSTGLNLVPGINGGPTYGLPAMYNVGGSADVVMWMYGLDGNSIFGGTLIKAKEHTNQANRPRYPAVSASATRFNVTYVEFSSTSPSNYTCYSTALDLTNQNRFGVNDRRAVVRELASYDFKRPASASRYDGGNYGSRYVGCAVTDNDGTYDIQAAVTVYPNTPTTPAVQYCLGNPNTTGDYSFITMTGNASTTNSKVLRASAMPLNQFGYFLAGLGTGTVVPPGSSGVFCLGGASFGRYNENAAVFFTGNTGASTLSIDPTSIRGPSGNIVGMVGQTWRFQCWHRENGGTSNFTNGVSLLLE